MANLAALRAAVLSLSAKNLRGVDIRRPRPCAGFNGVKCMSNYSELSTYHEYGNIFRCLVQFLRYKSQKSEL